MSKIYRLSGHTDSQSLVQWLTHNVGACTKPGTFISQGEDWSYTCNVFNTPVRHTVWLSVQVDSDVITQFVLTWS
jgi:hypothetical protein